MANTAEKLDYESFTAAEIISCFLASLEHGQHGTTPYPHWFLNHCLPRHYVSTIDALPFPAPDLHGQSGKRELHNATRRYFDAENQALYPIVRAFSDAFQSKAVTDRIASHFRTEIEGSYLRIEFAQDIDGFWLEPHTDLGVKLFTCLLYVSDEPGHEALGTDIYDSGKNHVGRSPFAPGAAMVFVPSDLTYHGFEARPIPGIRKSIIINFVTNDWRAREQLAFPEQPIS